MSKRGLSGVFAVMLIILVAIISVSLIWVVVNNFVLDTGTNIISKKGSIDLDLQIVAEGLVVNETAKTVFFKVKRGSGKGNLTGLKVILEDLEENQKSVSIGLVIEELEVKPILVDYSSLGLGNLSRISIAPIYMIKKFGRSEFEEVVGGISATHIISGGGNGGGNPPGRGDPVNTIPFAFFEAIPENGATPLDVMFNASNSRDPDGVIVLYSWDFGDGEFLSGSNLVVVNHTYNYSGVYGAVLTVWDDFGSNNSYTKIVNVSGQFEDRVSQYGITWFFDREYEAGQFANGDWWVVGPVVISDISPGYQRYNFSGNLKWLNGWEVNPSDIVEHGFDERAPSFNSNFVPNLPYFAQPGESIVKADSYEEAGVDCKIFSNNGPCLYTAAVLTVVDFPPPNGGLDVFRPPYFGGDKPYYFVSDLQTDLLLSLDPAGNEPSLDSIRERFERVQLDHKYKWPAQYIRPDQNLPEYPASISRDTGDAVLRLMLNDDISVKMPALVSYVQAGIDYYYMAKNGASWPATGGYGSGRKLPLAFSAVLLDNQEMKDFVFSAGVSSPHIFGEDGQTYLSDKGEVLWGSVYDAQTTCSEQMYWQSNVTGSGDRDCRDPYGYIDGGDNPGDRYQGCCTSQPWKGTALAVRLIPELENVWNYQPFLDYVDRWVTFGTWTQPDPCAGSDGVWGNYGVTYGPDGNGGCILGGGRFISKHGYNTDGGGYRSLFAESMWETYRGQIGFLSPEEPDFINRLMAFFKGFVEKDKNVKKENSVAVVEKNYGSFYNQKTHFEFEVEGDGLKRQGGILESGAGSDNSKGSKNSGSSGSSLKEVVSATDSEKDSPKVSLTGGVVDPLTRTILELIGFAFVVIVFLAGVVLFYEIFRRRY